MEIDITKWNVIDEDAFKKMHYDSGVLVKNFDPENIDIDTFDPETLESLCTTSGNIGVAINTETIDLGEDVNGLHGQYSELMVITRRTYQLTFTSLDLDLEGLKIALGAADIEGNCVKPRGFLKDSDIIKNIALIMFRFDGAITVATLDYGLSTGGVNLTTSKEGKVTNQMTLTGLQSLKNQTEPAMRFYAFESNSITLDKHEAEMAVGDTLELTATAPEGVTIVWASDGTSEATVSDGTVTAVSAGTVTITASYTDSETEKTYSDSCVIHITAE